MQWTKAVVWEFHSHRTFHVYILEGTGWLCMPHYPGKQARTAEMFRSKGMVWNQHLYVLVLLTSTWWMMDSQWWGGGGIFKNWNGLWQWARWESTKRRRSLNSTDRHWSVRIWSFDHSVGSLVQQMQYCCVFWCFHFLHGAVLEGELFCFIVVGSLRSFKKKNVFGET